MNVLVTGGAGFLGSYVCDLHLERGDAVVALDLADGSKLRHRLGHARLRFVRGSVADRALIEREIEACDVVYHLAAVADPKVYVSDPLRTMQLDLVASLHVVDAAAQYQRKLVFTSSSEVYGRNPDVPWAEDDDRVLGSTTVNRWCYSTAKAAVEHYILAHHQRSGLEFVIYRPFNFYGPRLDSLGAGRVITMFLERFLTGAPVEVHGDGTQTRTFCYVEDAARAVVAGTLADSTRNTVLNVGSDQERSIMELAEVMKRVGRFESDIELVPYQEAFGGSYEDIPRRAPDLTRIHSLLGWKATTPLADGLARTICYFRRQHAMSPAQAASRRGRRPAPAATALPV